MTSSDGATVELPCGQTVAAWEIDLGLRELVCPCGDRHAVVVDGHPPTRFLPEELINALRSVTQTADSFDQFDTPHLIGLIIEHEPAAVTTIEAEDIGEVGYAMAWITTFDAVSLHERIVTEVLELMDHAMSHAGDTDRAEFEAYLQQFDVETFVTEYRDRREFTGPSDSPA